MILYWVRFLFIIPVSHQNNILSWLFPNVLNMCLVLNYSTDTEDKETCIMLALDSELGVKYPTVPLT